MILGHFTVRYFSLLLVYAPKDHRKKCNGLYLYFDAFFCFLYFDAVAVVLDRRFSFDFLNIHPCTMHACA